MLNTITSVNCPMFIYTYVIKSHMKSYVVKIKPYMVMYNNRNKIIASLYANLIFLLSLIFCRPSKHLPTGSWLILDMEQSM